MTLFFLTLKNELFSKKSLGVIAFYILSPYLVGRYGTTLDAILSEDGHSVLVDALLVIYALLGYLFSSVLFSGLIAEEVESQTMRYLTPYLSRKRIYLEKYFASVCYFLILTVISLVVLFFTKRILFFPIFSFLAILGFYLYIQSLVMLVSTVVSSQRLSNLISLLMSILFPLLYSLSLLKNWVILKVIRWIFPYHYLSKTWEIVVLYLLTIFCIWIGIKIFQKKEI